MFPARRSSLPAGLLFAALLVADLLIGMRASALTYHFNNPDTSDSKSYLSQIKAAAKDPSGNGGLESRTYAQYVLEEYARIDAGEITLTTNAQNNIITALCLLQTMEDNGRGQGTKTGSTYKHYPGNFAWELSAAPPDNVSVEDTNAVEFVVQALARVPLRYASLENSTTGTSGTDGTTHTAVSLINSILAFAKDGVIAHGVLYYYTNMAVTKAWNLLALSQVLADSNLLSQGRAFFNAWYLNTQNTGINDFLSPTYTAADMDSLGFIVLYSTDQEMRGLAQAALKLF